MLLINKSVVFVTCSNFVWFIQVLIICFNVYPHIFSCRILNVFYPYNLWDINMYMHIRTCLADNFVHMFVSGFFHEKYNLDLFHFKSQDFYIIIFHRKKWFCTVLSTIASIISHMYLKKWNKVYTIIRQSSCFFFKSFINVQQLIRNCWDDVAQIMSIAALLGLYRSRLWYETTINTIKVHVDINKFHVIIIISHYNLTKLHVDINRLHVNNLFPMWT